MKKIILISSLLIILVTIKAQTYYVDAVNGNDKNSGSQAAPLKTLQATILMVNTLTGDGELIVKLQPGVYSLDDKLVINPLKQFNANARLIVEASIMPNDSNWTPAKMPVIQSTSANNSITQFPHSSGLLIASSHITIRGLKFLGNANPKVKYYYPINCENVNIKDIEVSQCYFIAERNSTPIQGGVWLIAQDISINQCVFKECRNAVLVFRNSGSTTITNNIITHAYESAFWIAAEGKLFKFENNIISNCNFFWANCDDVRQEYKIEESLITINNYNVGQWNAEKFKLVESDESILLETNVKRDGEVDQILREGAELPWRYLHIKQNTTGSNINAGIFVD